MSRHMSTIGYRLCKWLGLASLLAGLLVLLAAAAGAQQTPARMDVLIGFSRPPGPAEEALVRGFGGGIKHRYRLVPAIAASIPETALAGLLRSPRVVTVELDGRVHAIDTELDATWGVRRIGSGTVHAGGNRGEGVLVAVIDSGIDCGHPDLAANCVAGWDFVNNDGNPADDNGHGTHVAGTVAAAANGFGVIGAAPEAGLIALKVLNASGSGSFSDIIAALQWIVDYNAGNPPDAPDILVTNNSYGSSSNPGSLVEQAFINSTNAGVLHIAAAGNAGNPGGKGDNVGYPARYDSVVAVAATGQNDGRASFSSTGAAVELAAPGVSINSTLTGGGYGTKSGTSMASPHVAGAAALVISAGYATSPAQVRQRLQDTADDLGSAGRDSHYGYGLVDAVEAVGDPATGDLPPEIAISSPSQGETVWGNVTIVADAWDDFGVDQVEFFANGTSIGTDSSATGGWSVSWDTCALAVPDGEHNLTASATDEIGQFTVSGAVGVNVDNAGNGNCGNTGGGGDGGILLSATGYKVKGLQKADLEWAGAAGTSVAVRRNGVVIATTTNDGFYTDDINNKGGGSYTYQVCEIVSGSVTSTCSGSATVTF